MSFSFTADGDGRSRILVTNEPNYIVPLQIAPPSLEDILMRGKWLCVSMSVWNSNDIHAGVRAAERIKERHGAVNLGLRPFDFPEENYTWIPNSREKQGAQLTEILARKQYGSLEIKISGKSDASPVWMGISDGNLVSVRYGQLSVGEIDEFISMVIASEGGHICIANHS